MRTVLFVCTGNTCRSPMAEAIAKAWLGRGSLGDPGRWFVASAGVAALDGLPVSAETIEALHQLDIEHVGTSKMLTPDMIRKADVVLCMTAAHVDTARSLLGGDGEEQAKVLQIDPGSDLEDPIGYGQAAYDALAQRLIELIPRRLREVLEP